MMMKKFLRLLVPLLLFCGATACAAPARTPPALQGVIDLRQWDFEQNGSVNLNGEWEFYWGQWLTAADLLATPTGFIPVPGSWRDYQVNGQPLSGDGYATYRLTVLLPPDTRPETFLALKMPVFINTAHRLYVDGQRVGSAGQVGTTAAAMLPQQRPYVVVFAPTGAQMDILLHISDFYQSQGGVIQPIGLGTATQIQQLTTRQSERDFFLLGSIFMIGVYHLALFALRRRDISPLYFGLFCVFGVGVSLLVTQPQFFSETISPRWEVLVRTLFSFGGLSLVTQMLFFHQLFEQDASPWILRGLAGVTILLVSLAVWVPLWAVMNLVLPLLFCLVLVHLYILGVLVSAVVHHRAEARISLMGYLPLLLAGINDALFFSQRASGELWLPVGLFLFILAQAYLLSARSARLFTQTEMLSADLRVSEEKYRTLFEDSTDLIFMTALDGRLEAINPACFAVLGYTPAEALRLNLLDFYANRADRLRFQEAVTQTGAVTDFPVTLLHKAGHTLESQITATMRHAKTGQAIGYQGIVHDLTAYQQAEAARQRVWALEELNQSLEQRVADRATALTEANSALQAEIEHRQSHQQEKDRLLALAQQQSEHLRAMSQWLMELPKVKHPHQAAPVDEDIQQKMTDIRQNLSALQGLAGFDHNLNLTTYVSNTLRLLTEVEIYVEQVAAALDEPPPSGDPLADHPLLQLSSRERQVLKLMAEGKSNPEIANLLTIRLNTVHTYLKRIRTKLDIQDTPGLINFAREHGLLR